MGQPKNRGIIGILTGGGDVPGLNPAIRAVTIRALREGYKVIGIKRGWGGLIDIVRDPQYDNSGNFFELTEEIVNKAGRTGGTSCIHPGPGLLTYLKQMYPNIYRINTWTTSTI